MLANRRRARHRHMGSMALGCMTAATSDTDKNDRRFAGIAQHLMLQYFSWALDWEVSHPSPPNPRQLSLNMQNVEIHSPSLLICTGLCTLALTSVVLLV